MKTVRFFLVLLSAMMATGSWAQNELASVPKTQVPSANTVLKRAVVEAGNLNKKVLLMFHASWCGWCHKMDSSLVDVSCKKFIEDNFVITHVTVSESKGKKDLENAGGQELMEKYNGKDMGLPYWIILDKNARLLFDSQVRTTLPDGTVKGQNIGCPASQPEVDNFIAILKQTTTLTEPQLAIIAKRFRQNEN